MAPRSSWRWPEEHGQVSSRPLGQSGPGDALTQPQFSHQWPLGKSVLGMVMGGRVALVAYSGGSVRGLGHSD